MIHLGARQNGGANRFALFDLSFEKQCTASEDGHKYFELNLHYLSFLFKAKWSIVIVSQFFGMSLKTELFTVQLSWYMTLFRKSACWFFSLLTQDYFRLRCSFYKYKKFKLLKFVNRVYYYLIPFLAVKLLLFSNKLLSLRLV